MMQSVALTDSCQHDEDFVIVEALESDVEAYGNIPAYVYDDEDDDDDDYDDLASYDYCEEYSVASVVQSFTTSDNLESQAALESLTFQHEFLDYPLSYNLNQEGQHSNTNSSSVCVPKILSPGISLFSFGEANSSDEAEGDSVKGSIAASEISTSTREERSRRNDQKVKNKDNGNDGADSDAAPSASSGSSVGGGGGSDSHSLRYTKPFAPMTMTTTKREESSRASSGSSSSSVVSSNTYQKTQSVGDDSSVHSTSSKTSQSRVSNKKRRKQLKLAKKAAAAATAAAALSPNSRTKKSPTRKIQMAVRSSNKKQVACATQGLASYREEVIRNNKKLR
jgi:hypothetical protein